MKKQDCGLDKYGYAQTGIVNRRTGKKLISTVTYENEEIMVDFDMIFANKGTIGNIANIKKFKEMVEGKNIVEAFTSILVEKFSYASNLTLSLQSYFESLPEDILMNDEAVKEILSGIPKDDYQLLIAVANRIKFNREDVKARNTEKKSKNAQIKQQAEQIRKEFGL